MGKWPQITDSAPGILVTTSGTEWLPTRSALPVPFEGQAFLPTPLPGELDPKWIVAECWEDIERAVVSLAALNGKARSLPNPHLIARPMQLREAQASSRIENTIASAEEVALADLEHNVRDDSREVRNYLTALETALDSDRPISQGLIKSMHTILMSNVRGGDRRPGQYRLGQAYIHGEAEGFDNARFVPPPAEHLQACMDNLEHFVREESRRFPLVVSAAITHYQFETIHPFSDGNGRLGRMLIMLQLCRGGVLERPLLEFSSFLDTHRRTYFDLLLAVSTRGAWLDWIRFFCRGVAHQATRAAERTERLLTLRARYIEAITEPRASVLLRDLVDWLFTKPAVRVADVAARAEIRHQAAQRHVDRLVEKGILTEITGRNYDRIYVARGVLAAIEGEDEPPS